MSVEDGFNFIFDRLLIESDQEEAEDDDGYVESLVFPVEESDESKSEDEEGDGDDHMSGEWSKNVVSQHSWIFDDNRTGVNQQLLLGCVEPLHYYELFMVGIWDLVVRETNRYAIEKDKLWEPTNVEEMKKFIALCLQMAIVRLPRLRDYWSPCSIFGSDPIASKVMAMDRFEKLLGNLHLANNAAYDGKNRLYKISPLVELVNRNCNRIYRPGKEVCIDETLVPFRGIVASRQHISQEKHKYGVKLLKLCSKGGYTCRILVYPGRGPSRTASEAESVAVKLMGDLLGNGRHLYTENWCTSVSLAESMLQKKTHLSGTCRRNRKGLPKDVIQKKLKRGELEAQQNQSGVMVLKWRDKRDIIMLSTAHDATIAANSKPQVVESYNQAKLFVDASDKMTSYTPYLRRTSKWYIRLFFYLVTHTCLVNAWKIYCENVQTIAMDEFKIQVYFGLVKMDRVPTPSVTHVLEETPEKKWRRCVGCYRKVAKYHDSVSASKRAKQVSTRCSQCNKHFCLDCFNNTHKKCAL